MCEFCKFWENPERQHETFRFVVYEWDIDLAKKLLEAAPRETQTVPLDNLRNVVDWPRKENSIDIMRVFVEAEHVPHVDATVPLVVGWIPPLKGEEKRQWLVLDGHHRIAKAIDEKRDFLEALVLTPEESDSVLVDRSGRYRPKVRKARVPKKK